MKIQVGFTAFHRTDYFADVLDSWKTVRGVDTVFKSARIEPSGAQDAMSRLAHESGLGIRGRVNHSLNGVLHNPWVVLNEAFDEDKADFVILAEDDILVSDDILEYFRWAAEEYGPEEALGVCANTSTSGTEAGRTFLVPHFEVWIWGTWKESWYSFIKDTWDHDYSTYNVKPGYEAGWDWNLSRMARSVKPFVHVEVSRSKHIGEFGGAHMTPDLFSAVRCPTFEPHRDPCRFYRATGPSEVAVTTASSADPD